MAVVELVGEKINHGGGHRLKIPYVYSLYGPTSRMDCLKEVIT